ncbi:amidohydrolase family protein [Ferrimonas marina]|uniref:N-acyl-D-glutamate deacylase n=1 Tax=Ferrimonas marina TaxID=299255 RepID=A0A1M5P682_9GAMM|nr:amidohydrolase family protein [Ferrimonas marina]SHG97268.1 N-acyl-D-glutamate deacylase [Ferrimonas marina]
MTMSRSLPWLMASLMISPAALAAPYDLVINHGHVIDPETELSDVRHLGIKDGTIVSVSETPLQGSTSIDAKGLVVTPGFIDLHAHGMEVNDLRMQAMQGVTTALEMESGVLPIGRWYDIQAEKALPIHYGAAAAWTFARSAAFMQVEPEPTVAYFQQAQQHNNWIEQLADEEHQARILSLVQTGLDEGALGIGVNAGYAPGHGRKEFYQIAKMGADNDVGTFVHTRYASVIERQSTFEAVQELIANAMILNSRMHLHHVNSTSLKDIDSIIEMLDAALEQGAPVTIGAYPYGAASTVIGAAMFRSPDWRARMQSSAEAFQLGDERLTEEKFESVREQAPGTFVVWHFLDEEKPKELAVLDRSIKHPSVLIESDAMPWMRFTDGGIETYSGDEWPLPADVFSHPRSAGAFAKVLRSYVRERQLMSLEEAVAKMTLAPAQVMDYVPQMRKKGRIQPGMDADIVVFDPETIADRATFQAPNQTAVGVHSLVVNGERVIDNGVLDTQSRAGQPIRRPQSEAR